MKYHLMTLFVAIFALTAISSVDFGHRHGQKRGERRKPYGSDFPDYFRV